MQKASAIDLTTLNDPYVSVLCEEAQTAFGKALSRTEMQRLVSLYLNDGWQPDVVLLCCAEVARQGRRTVGALSRELLKWRDAGVETGEDAERYLKQQAQRESWCIESAALFGIAPAQLSRWERGAIARWHEDWRFGADMIEEALLRGGQSPHGALCGRHSALLVRAGTNHGIGGARSGPAGGQQHSDHRGKASRPQNRLVPDQLE